MQQKEVLIVIVLIVGGLFLFQTYSGKPISNTGGVIFPLPDCTCFSLGDWRGPLINNNRGITTCDVCVDEPCQTSTGRDYHPGTDQDQRYGPWTVYKYMWVRKQCPWLKEF